MELCFVPNGNYVQFIHAYAKDIGQPVQDMEGEIVTEAGEVVGRHAGVHQFTVGQRKGLGFSTGKALYVISLDVENNRVIVGEDDALRTTGCDLEGVNWIICARPEGALRVMAKIRHKHDPAPASVEPLGDFRARLLFDAPQRAITPGQAAVFYDGDCVVGGGWIR